MSVQSVRGGAEVRARCLGTSVVVFTAAPTLPRALPQTTFKETTPPGEPLLIRSQIVRLKESDTPGSKATVQVGVLCVGGGVRGAVWWWGRGRGGASVERKRQRRNRGGQGALPTLPCLSPPPPPPPPPSSQVDMHLYHLLGGHEKLLASATGIFKKLGALRAL